MDRAGKRFERMKREREALRCVPVDHECYRLCFLVYYLKVFLFQLQCEKNGIGM